MHRVSPWAVLRLLLVVLAALAAAVVLPRLGDPAPDLVLLVVVAGALLRGPVEGALLGVLAGWVVDLVPPAGHPLGLSALVYAAVGALAGAGRRFGTWSALLPVLVTALAAILVQAVGLALRATSGAPLGWGHAGMSVLLTTAVGAVVVPLLVHLERALVRRRLA